MTAKFTPGPWIWQGEDYRGGWGWQLLVGPDGEGLMCGENNKAPYENLKAYQSIEPKFCKEAPRVHVQEANANLIAAAPELYEALENILSEMHIDDYGDWALNTSFDVESIHAVLAKARGD